MKFTLPTIMILFFMQHYCHSEQHHERLSISNRHIDDIFQRIERGTDDDERRKKAEQRKNAFLERQKQRDKDVPNREKTAEERKKAFLDRQQARERGEPDPVQIKEQANRKKAGDTTRKNTGKDDSNGKTEGKNGKGKNANGVTYAPTTAGTTTTTTEDPNRRGNADNRTDAALSVVKNVLLTDEPMETGEADECENCELIGISTVERIGRATAIDLDEDRKRVKVYLGLRYLNATCNCTFGAATGVVTASIVKLVVYLDVLVNFETDETHIYNVTIKFPGILNFHFSGSNFWGWIVQLFTGIFKGKILWDLRSQIITEIPKLIHENKHELRHLGMI